MLVLAPLFLLTAVVYGAAGFGGGSTYTALLALHDSDPQVVPIVSLTCNILVVSIGSSRFARAGHLNLRGTWPLMITSVPMAFLGGTLPVSRMIFTGLLAASLVVAAILMLWQHEAAPPRERRSWPWLQPIIGGALGLLAGIVGIGGGIYLAPVLHLLRWNRAHAIAGTCALFILVNSVAGLAGQILKSGAAVIDVLHGHWLLLPAVVVGGLLGSTLATRRLPDRPLRVLTAGLILVVAFQLTGRFIAAAG